MANPSKAKRIALILPKMEGEFTAKELSDKTQHLKRGSMSPKQVTGFLRYLPGVKRVPSRTANYRSLYIYTGGKC